MSDKTHDKPEQKSLNFIHAFVEEDLEAGRNNKRVHTRFPPEPNGYLHLGHAKAIHIDFGTAEKYGGKCNLRFDDTNPVKEEVEYIDSIKEDIHWLGYDWEDREFYASDYFGNLFDFACDLIKKGLAYVDDQSSEEIAAQKGTPSEPGKVSPFRDRPAEESLDLFKRMNQGEFKEGTHVLRAKIDMASSNMHMRDPVIYRIINHAHHRTRDTWKVYPMYDFAHGQSDYFEGITHSLCTLEFEVHRPLYDWFIDQLKTDDYRPRQIEFNRLNITYMVMSKRKMLQLVNDGMVNGWDDPRMPTLSGMRRRGYTPDSIKNFINSIGYTKVEALNDFSLLEFAVREDLNKKAVRIMGVLDPIKVIITNYPEGKTEALESINNPEDESMGSRKIPFSRELYIERSDFMEDPPRKFFRLGPDREVRLKSAYIIQCNDYEKDAVGNVTTLYCTYDEQSKSGQDTSGKKVKGTLHWVSTQHAVEAEVRLYDRLFSDPDPDGHKDKAFTEFINPDSLNITKGFIEPSVKSAKSLDHFQFQRIGYFNVDPDSTPEKLVFNRTVPLRDNWSKKK
ncbi:MAG TPA: glutamine--tRNA ligase/YqeY domain fusion protein [Bacteroidales bacterium]|nr:glutamine--tRNA ligase/YqeY domain fusion protein [Bacteroidales bacterium]